MINCCFIYKDVYDIAFDGVIFWLGYDSEGILAWFIRVYRPKLSGVCLLNTLRGFVRTYVLFYCKVPPIYAVDIDYH